MTPLFQHWGCGRRVWQMQMWERVVSAGCAPWAGCWAAEPPSPLQNKPLPQPQESGTWGTGPAGHELLQSCWCPSLWDRGSLRATVSTWIFKKKNPIFFFLSPPVSFPPTLGEEECRLMHVAFFPAENLFCVCVFICFVLGFFSPIHSWSNIWFQFAAQKKKGCFSFSFSNLLKRKGLLCVSSFCCLIFVSALFSSGSGYGSVVFWLRKIFLFE